MTLLVLGRGQLGQSLAFMAAEHRWPCVVLGHADLDITSECAVAAAFTRHRPWAVINTAALTAVDRAENEAQLAMTVNGVAPRHIAQAAVACDAIVVQMSTDYVFDGRKESPYVESDITCPVSIYGRSKLAGEQAVAGISPRHLIVRTAWLFSAAGNNFVNTMLRVGRTHGEVAVVNDQLGCPTPANGLAEALLRMLEQVRQPSFDAWGIYHVAGAPSITWHGFAEAIFAAADLRVTVKAIDTAAFNAPAPRPAHSALDCSKVGQVFGLPPIDWQAGLAAILQAHL